MKKLVGPFAKVFGAIFAVGVFVIVISLSYKALGRIFPDSLFDQSAGMLLFDAAAIVWFLTFIGNSKSVSQYVASGLGFLLGLLGSLGLIGIEVGISSGMLNAADMVRPLTYVFIGAAVGHLIITYGFHGSAPEISAQISMGVEQAKAQDEGMRQAELAMSRDLGQLGNVISARILEDVYRNLNMPRQLIDARALPMDDSLHAQSNGYPLPAKEKSPSLFADPRGWLRQKFGRDQSNGTQINDQTENPTQDYNLNVDMPPEEWQRVEKYLASKGYVKNSNLPHPTKPNYYPPYGDRQHPDVVFARLPSDELQNIQEAWLAYDNARTGAIDEAIEKDEAKSPRVPFQPE